ncbi:hypothetical protein NM688_g4672 [Phlebia brevispora]|uniref:Uncharacterized protein n=1 Tax=Phlebia brevispora TaxID=194682 RepID=A0ACC1T278_9APHY|nr:hypothetical protein NM688_g4672 [Phlebia brevispora]
MLSSARTNILQLGRSRLAPHARRCYATTSTAEHRDVVIVGGGPAGLALASALSSSKAVRDSLRVTLVEAGDLVKIKEWQMPADSFHNRVSSITNASRGFLEEIGVWEWVDGARTQPIEDMQANARIAFTASDLPIQRTSHLTTMVENLNLQRASLRYLSRYPEVELLDNVKVQSITPDGSEGGSWPLVHLSDGRVIRARLLIGADGHNSPVRKYAGIESYGWAYDTHAIVATLHHAAPSPLSPPNSIHELWERVQKEWEAIPKEVCQNLIASMPRRVEAVIKAKGGHTKY